MPPLPAVAPPQVEGPDVFASKTLSPNPRSVGVARRWVGAVVAEAGASESVELVQLLVSELVTNAIIHARSEVTVEVTVEHVADGPRVHVSIADGDSRPPRFELADLDALGGRGLSIVRALAARCGVRQLEFGKAVWFELLPTAAARPRGSGDRTSIDRTSIDRTSIDRTSIDLTGAPAADASAPRSSR